MIRGTDNGSIACPLCGETATCGILCGAHAAELGVDELLPERVIATAAPSAVAYLIDGWGRQHPIATHCSIGRAAGNRLQLVDASVEAHHARIEADPSHAHRIIDLSGRTGTFVNGERRAERVLLHGDRLQLGRVSLYYCELADAAAGTSWGCGTPLEPAGSRFVTRSVVLRSAASPSEPLVLLEPAGGGGGVIRWGNVHLQLSMHQYQLLAALLEQSERDDESGGFIATEALLARISWNTAWPTHNNLKQLVCRLRRTLRDVGLQPLLAIEWSAGAGYCLVIHGEGRSSPTQPPETPIPRSALPPSPAPQQDARAAAHDGSGMKQSRGQHAPPQGHALVPANAPQPAGPGCVACGAPAAALLCSSHRARIAAPTSLRREQVSFPSCPQPRAQLIDPWERGHPIGEELTIGRRRRDDQAGIFEASVSRAHARLWRDAAGQWWIDDLGSTNGTMVEDERVGASTALGVGTVIAIGNVKLLFAAIAPPASPVEESLSIPALPMTLEPIDDSGDIVIGGARLPLAASQLQLLQVLAERMWTEEHQPGPVRGFVRCSELLACLSWATSGPSENHLKQRVRRLRQSLARAGIGDLIEARHRLGYRLKVVPVAAS